MTSNNNQPDFDQLMEQHRSELLIHCYRMSGSLFDAEDMVQETFLRAWKNMTTYTEQGNFRAWLYQIATNTCLDALRRKKKRALIQADVPMSTAPYPSDTPLNDKLWLEPLPDTLLPEAQQQNPEVLYNTRESVSLAFLTVLHKLSPQQRAILILRDVLGFKAREVADMLDLSLPAANATLLRARKALDDPHIKRSRKVAHADKIEAYLHRYIAAWETKNIAKLVPLLQEDVVMSMPPLPTWYAGLTRVQTFLTTLPFSGEATERWKTKSIGVNGQPSLAIYHYDAQQGCHLFFGIHVLTIDTEGITRIEHFLAGDHAYLKQPLKAPWLPYFNLPSSL